MAPARAPHRTRSAVVLALFFTAASADTTAAPWRVRAPGDAAARAEIVNDQGDRLAVFRGDGDAVLAEFVTAAPSPLGATSCPTFQIDQRRPLHHFERGDRCSVEGHRARYTLARLDGRRLESAVLYQLMNGSSVAFRFVTGNGAYHETRFALTRSKNAMLRVLGRDLDVQPGDSE